MPENVAKVNVAEIPDDVFQTACRVLSVSVRRYFENPENQSEYQRWKEQREKRKEQENVTRKNITGAGC